MTTKAQAQTEETAAERYARIRAKQLENAQEVECIDRADDGSHFPSIEGCGMTWKARRAPKEFWVTSGMMPSSLAATMLEAAGGASNGNVPESLARSLNPSQIVQSIEFSNKVVRYTALEPKIVDEVADPATEVQRADVMLCCYNTLLRWQMTGGDEAEGLENFPKKRR